MRILILTRDDPVSTPVYLRRVIMERSKDVVAVIAVDTAPIGLSYLRKRLNVRGFRASVLKWTQIKLCQLMNAVRHVSLSALTTDYRIPLIHVKSIKTRRFIQMVRDMKPDIILSVTCPKLIGRELLGIPPLGGINYHCSILPKGRGRDPAFWSLYQGHKWTAVTIHYMDEEMDNGDIILQNYIPIRTTDTVESLYKRIAVVSAGAITSALDDIEAGTNKRLPNDKNEATYFDVPAKDDIVRLNRRGKSLIGLADCFAIVGR